MAALTLSSDALDRAQAILTQAKALANMAGQLEVVNVPDDTLSNSMWALADLLKEAHELLCQAKFSKPEGGDQ